MKRGQLAAVLIIIALVAAIGAFVIFSERKAGQAVRTLQTAYPTQPTIGGPITGQTYPQPSQYYVPPPGDGSITPSGPVTPSGPQQPPAGQPGTGAQPQPPAPKPPAPGTSGEKTVDKCKSDKTGSWIKCTCRAQIEKSGTARDCALPEGRPPGPGHDYVIEQPFFDGPQGIYGESLKNEDGSFSWACNFYGPWHEFIKFFPDKYLCEEDLKKISVLCDEAAKDVSECQLTAEQKTEADECVGKVVEKCSGVELKKTFSGPKGWFKPGLGWSR